MIRFLFKFPVRFLLTKQESNLSHLQFLHNSISKTPKQQQQRQQQEEPNHSSFTISHLLNSCDLSPQSALSISKKIHPKKPENPNSLIKLLKSYDFTNTQITKVITKCPVLLSSNLDKTLLPKLNYFQSVGYLGKDLANLVSSVPHILTASLENKLKPNFEFLASIIGDNKRIASAVKQTSRLLQASLETNLLPNVKILKSRGITDRNIAKLVATHPRVMMLSHERFAVNVELVNEMGFNPLSTMFIHGLAAVSRFSPLTWESKFALYKSLGWSKPNVTSAFAKQPFFMMVSEDKIRKMTEFYATKMKWGSSFLAAHPVLICMSLEKRVIPRCSALSILESKGLIEWNSSVHFLMTSEKDFLNNYVVKYSKVVPEVLEAYKGNVEFPGFGKQTALRKCTRRSALRKHS